LRKKINPFSEKHFLLFEKKKESIFHELFQKIFKKAENFESKKSYFQISENSFLKKND